MSGNHKISKVLLVDDDDNIRLIASMSLKGLTNWNILQAASANEALTLIESESPDVIILDMMMPDMDGITLLEKMQGRFAESPPRVIFMTAKVQTQKTAKYLAMGAKGVIVKPFDPMTLPDQVEKILGGK